MDRGTRKPDIERAIYRSRQSRAAMRARRRRSALFLGLLAVSLAGAGTYAIGELTGNDMVQAAVTQAKSLADLLRARSPGERSEGQLTKTKHARALSRMRPAAMPKLHQALEPKIAMVDLNRLLELPPAPMVGEAPPSLTPLDLAPPSIAMIVAPPGANSPPGGSPPGSPPPGGTPPGSPPPGTTPPGNTPPTVIVPVPSAVPEPATWATMLLGFALVGWRVRSRHQPLLKQA